MPQSTPVTEGAIDVSSTRSAAPRILTRVPPFGAAAIGDNSRTSSQVLPHPLGRHPVAVAENDLASLADLVAVRCVERLGIERTGELQTREPTLPREPFDLSHQCRAATSSCGLRRDVA